MRRYSATNERPRTTDGRNQQPEEGRNPSEAAYMNSPDWNRSDGRADVASQGRIDTYDFLAAMGRWLSRREYRGKYQYVNLLRHHTQPRKSAAESVFLCEILRIFRIGSFLGNRHKLSILNLPNVQAI